MSLPNLYATGERHLTQDYLLTLSVSDYFSTDYDPSSGNITNANLSLLTVSVKARNRLEGSLRYDVIKKVLGGCELSYRFSDSFKITAGIMRSVYYYEMSRSPRMTEAIGPSLVADYLGGYGKDLSGVSSRGRDCGILAEKKLFPQGNRYLLQLSAGVFNGNGCRFLDDDHNKEFQGRLLLRPSQHLSISTGVLAGTDKERLSGALWIEQEHLFFRCEDILGQDRGTVSNGISSISGYRFNAGKMAVAGRLAHMKTNVESKPSITQAQICFTHFMYDQDISYRIQYGRTFLYDTSGMSCLSPTISIFLIVRLSSTFEASY